MSLAGEQARSLLEIVYWIRTERRKKGESKFNSITYLNMITEHREVQRKRGGEEIGDFFFYRTRTAFYVQRVQEAPATNHTHTHAHTTDLSLAHRRDTLKGRSE